MSNKVNTPLTGRLKNAFSGKSYIIIFVVLCIAYFSSSTAVTWNGFMNVFRHSGVVGIISFGMALLIISGELDLSLGSMMAFVSSMTIVVLNLTGSIFVTVLFALFLSALCGFFNGVMVGLVKMPAFISTLATMLIYRSLAQYLCHAMPSTVTGGSNSLFKMSKEFVSHDALFAFGNGKLATIPVAGLFLLVVTIVLVYMTTSTKYGKKIYAIGSNEKAARLAGINVDWLRVSVFTLSGVLVGIASFLQVCMNGSIDPANTGSSFEMYAIASCVLGAVSMAGGKGPALGVLFGAMSYTVIDKIITALNVDSLINNAVKGAILLVAVFVQIMAPKLKRKH